MKVADSKHLLVYVSDFDVYSPAYMVVLWQNMNTPVGPVDLLIKYARRHFNMPLACGRVVIYIPALHHSMKCVMKYCLTKCLF